MAPVRYRFDGTSFRISRVIMDSTIAYRNMQRGDGRIALVIDNFAGPPFPGRGIKIHSRAKIVAGAEGSTLHIAPEPCWSRGIDESGLPGRSTHTGADSAR